MRERLLCQPSEFLPNRLIVETLTKELAERGLTIAFAEGDVGGGAFSNTFTIPGATRAFHLGGVFPSEESMIRLGVPRKIIAEFGKDSLPTAIAMADAVRKIRNDSLAIATTGNMSALDSNQPREVFLGFSMENRSSWSKTVILQPTPRVCLKRQLVSIGFSSTLFYLLGQKDKDVEKHLLSSQASKNLSPKELMLTDKTQNFVDFLKQSHLTIATMESCTGGFLADQITNTPGASEVLSEAIVAYCEDTKAEFDVDFKAMTWGVYTPKVSFAMASAMQKRTGADIVIATTGTMDTIDTRPYHNDTPPGTVYIATLFQDREPLVCQLKLPAQTREEMKIQVANVAFDLVWKVLAKPKKELFYPQTSDYALHFLNRT